MPLGPRTPDDSLLRHRSFECVALWFFLCSATGWIGVAMKRTLPRDARVWPLIVVPGLFAIGLGASEAWDAHRMWEQLSALGLQDPSFRWMGLLGIAFPLFTGGFLSAALWFQARVWQQQGRTGVCYECGYDLFGNVSGRCPECGTQIGNETTRRVRGSSRWYPELILFETAEERDEALRSAHSAARWKLRCWPFLACMIVLWVCCVIHQLKPLPIPWRWAVLGAALVMPFVAAWACRSATRSLLREKLRTSGIRVCNKCGCDMREVNESRCPECHADVP